jgi:multicomponent Na+:H+ antiporter subunit A
VLSFLGLAVALLPQLGEHLLEPYASTYPLGEPGHLVLWGGFGLVLWLTVGVLAVGGLLFLARDKVERWQARVPHVLEADLTYRRSMRKLDDLAADVTAVTQRGSLPLYLGVILTTWVLAVGTALVRGTSIPGEVRPWDYAAQTVFAAGTIVAAILVARARRRLKAVILAGISGYATAGMFLLYGAPDLAVTQVLVETITLVVFVLVLRRLPPYFSDRPLAASRWARRRPACTHPSRRTSRPRRTSSAAARTSSTSRSSTSARGTPWARSRCCSWPPRASRRSCSSRRAAAASSASARHRPTARCGAARPTRWPRCAAPATP